MARPVRLRQLATTDLKHATDYHRQEAGEQTALELIDVVEHFPDRLRGQRSTTQRMLNLSVAMPLGVPLTCTFTLYRSPSALVAIAVRVSAK